MKIKRIHFFLVALCLFWNIAIVAAQEQAPEPSFKEGDTWQFSSTTKGSITTSTEQLDGIYELVFAQGQVKVYALDGNKKTEMEIKPDQPGGRLLAYVAQNKERPSLKFPLSVGQKWTYEYEARPAGGRVELKYYAEVNVTGIEQVKTSGGSYKAYKLVRSERWRGTGQRAVWSSNTTTYFYSPETRSVVKSNTVSETSSATSEVELIKFTPGS